MPGHDILLCDEYTQERSVAYVDAGAAGAATAAGEPLSPAGTASFQTARDPFGVAVTPDGRWAFAVSMADTSVEVFQLSVVL